MTKAPHRIAYLGPEGTYAHQAARKRFAHNGHSFIPFETIPAVCQYVATRPGSMGVVPVINSSGGHIDETIDALLNDSLDLAIGEELTTNVSLALLGRRGSEIRTIYSHFAPLRHCRKWLSKTYPKAELVKVASTAVAAREAAKQPHAAAISSRYAASIYKLDRLRFPVPGARLNVTTFFVLARKCKPSATVDKTSLAVRLSNHPGSLYDFLTPFAETRLNLSRLISRPIEGKPNEFAFFIDVDADVRAAAMKRALSVATKRARSVRVLGSYPSRRTYRS